MNKIPIAILSLCVIALNTAPYLNKTNFFKQEKKYSVAPLAKFDFRNLRDTVYTSKDYFVEVNLLTQFATLYSRDGSIKKIPVSTGNDKVEDGIETRQGLFVIQWKAEKWHSVQFDSTLMLHWMGFNGGIGFHGLEGKSYYKHLGKKNVSHGCVRVSREDAEFLFNILDEGTPVLVHKNNSAIAIAFTDENNIYSSPARNEIRKSVSESLTTLYNGEYFTSSKNKILVNEKNITSEGLTIGDTSLIPSKQTVIPHYLWISPETPEHEKIYSLLDGNATGLLTLNSVIDSKPSRQKI